MIFFSFLSGVETHSSLLLSVVDESFPRSDVSNTSSVGLRVEALPKTLRDHIVVTQIH